MNYKLLLLLPFFAGIFPCLSFSNFPSETNSKYTKQRNEYRVSVSKDNPLRAKVTARIHMKGDTLFMSGNCPNYDYPEGWATFISSLEVTDSEGDPVSVEYASKSKWVLSAYPKNPITVRYTVDLSFTQVKWDVGNEQAGYSVDGAVYLVSKALFMFDESADSASEITFDLPKQWKLATAWKTTSDQQHRFSIPNNESLIENSLVYGDFNMHQFTEGAFGFIVALPGVAEKDAALINTTLSKIAKAYLRIFDKTPPTAYLITMFYADLDDGESFLTSMAFTLKDTVSEHNKIIWANQMAHELFHYWNSDLMEATDYGERQWFSEGTAEYYANMTLVREGIISESLFENKIEKVLGLYLNYRGWREGKTSLLEAGKNKGVHRFLVYNGGWATAMALDTLIMEHSEGKKNLDDFFRLMFERYSSKPYSYEDIVRTASEVCEKDLTDFFSKYVSGTELIPLEEYFRKLGYSMADIIYEGEMYLTKLPHDPSSLNASWLRN